MRAISRIVLTGSIAAAFAAASAAAAAQSRPRQLVTQYSCAEIQAIEADLGKASGLTPDAREEVRIVGAKCAADAHNKANPGQPVAVLVAPDRAALATDNKTFLRTVPLADAAGVAAYCAVAGGPVVTDKGPVACDAFVRGAKDALVVLTPTSGTGIAVTTRILALMGSGDPDGHLAGQERLIARTTRDLAAKDSQAAVDQPLLLVASTGPGSQLGGTGGQALHASKCLTTLGFGKGCDKK